MLERMLRGGFLTGGMLDDILMIALLDTGVPVWALDAAASTARSGIRTSREGEPLGRSARPAAAARGAARRGRRRGARWRCCSASSRAATSRRAGPPG